MEKQRIIFDIDGTLLKPNFSYEIEYFESVYQKKKVKNLFQ